MKRKGSHAFRLAAAVALLLWLNGCVERVMKISTDPQGARVFVNDQEIGVSPVKFSFLWYGDYDLIFRKEGYETLMTHYRVPPPWWQIPPFDLISETLIPTTIRDEHELPVYKLVQSQTPPNEDVVNRAVELRDRALFQKP